MNLLFTLFLRITAKYRDFRMNDILEKVYVCQKLKKKMILLDNNNNNNKNNNNNNNNSKSRFKQKFQFIGTVTEV